MRGACTCLHLGRQVQEEQEQGMRGGRGGGGGAGHKAKEKSKRRKVDSKERNIVSIVYETDTTTQHQIMLPQKTGTLTYIQMSLRVNIPAY